MELPQVFAVSHAGDFAFAGVSILSSIGCDYLAFGSECGDEGALSDIADLVMEVEGPRRDMIDILMEEGVSYPEAREAAVRRLNPAIDLAPLFSSNDILGIEYLKAMKKLGSYMVPLVVKRMGASHIVSATRAREELRKISEERIRLDHMDGSYFDIARALILEKTAEDIDEVPAGGEGLGNKLKSFESIYEGLYIRPLAFDEKGAELLRKIHDGDMELPIAESPTKTGDFPGLKRSMDITVRASDIYNIISQNDAYKDSDYVRKPIYVRG